METVILTAQGAVIVTELPTDKGTLEFLQGNVGGLVEHLPFPVQGVDAWINEEGKYLNTIDEEGNLVEGLACNEKATKILADAGLLFVGDWIAGDMVLTSCNEEGETTPLNKQQLDSILSLL
jgi:hypothetical protein